ncbi:unnamed protein product [Wickerhamomyces anomalus]
MSSQTYRSTRATGEQAFSFEETVLKGLASDGGLFVPSAIPQVDASTIEKWSTLSFQELAFEIMRLYIKESEIPDEDLKKLVHNSYSTFRHEEITPLNPIDEANGLYLLELFHGPTYAFKDVALQFVGNLFEYFLQRKNAGKTGADRDVLTVVGATSGDTGSAAIYGLRAQMTSVLDSNVHTLSVKGTFDDCQDIVKQIFGDVEFNKSHHVGAVNSINWARILAQQTYYFYSYFQLAKKVGSDKKIRFVVPSGNFGDILAGYYAKEMGLPADRLIIATNENDILDRFLKSSKYEKGGDVKATLSPAMDILISSNFERLLWYLVRNNVTKSDEKAGETINNWFAELKQTGSFTVPQEVIAAARKDFDSERVDNQETIKAIKDLYTSNTTKYVLDPHSAVGVTASYRHIAQDKADNVAGVNYISLSTAHPAKFADAVNQALSSIEGYSFDKEVLPEELRQLSSKELKIKLIEKADVELVKSAIIEELQKEGK